jgi:hypothetical protein
MRNYVLMILLSILSSNAMADKVSVGDWILDIQNDYSETFVGNDSGSVFGLLCSRESCVFYLDTKTQCDKGAAYPMLINSDSGATFVNSRCIHLPSKNGIRYVQSISDNDVVTAISTGYAIGFAIPMVGGQFKVVRFSLNGALASVAKASAAFSKSNESPASQKFKDTTM